MLNKWLGPRKSEGELLVDAVVWNNPPKPPRRLGDMSEKELKSELSQIHRVLRGGGNLVMSKDLDQTINFLPNGL